jgi:hypothetical protein
VTWYALIPCIRPILLYQAYLICVVLSATHSVRCLDHNVVAVGGLYGALRICPKRLQTMRISYSAELFRSTVASILAIVLVAPVCGTSQDREELDTQQPDGWQASANIIKSVTNSQQTIQSTEISLTTLRLRRVQ